MPKLITFNSLVKAIKADWSANNKDWSRPGFRALAIYRFGVWRMSINNKFMRAPFSILYRFLFRFARNRYGIELPYSAQIGNDVVIEHQHGIVIHGNAIIGNDTIIRQGVTIGNRYGSLPYEAPSIGNGVNIGAGAIILGKIMVGDNSSIGANSVVLHDVPANITVAGNPAKIINKN